jgi:hypothetical protein
MEAKMLERQNRMLHHLAQLPRLMIHIHGRDNISEFLLHELCSEPCFNLRKAAYFVDNPDFKLLRGVAGFSDDQAFNGSEIWQNPAVFSEHMQKAPFNNQVRSIYIEEPEITDNEQKFLQDLAATLGFDSCSNCSWKMRHDNHGILMYEKADPSDSCVEDHLVDGMSLLSFCPVF